MKNARGRMATLQAQFQLKERLRQAQSAHQADALAHKTDAQTIVDEDVEHVFTLNDQGQVLPAENESVEPRLPERRLKAWLRRSRTHNEQIIMAPCGIILACETFYGAEAVSTIAVSNVITTMSSSC
jgi:hypothetical protein